MPTPAEQTNKVNVSFTKSNDGTVVSLVLSHEEEITNAMLADIFSRHAEVLLRGLV